MLPVARPGTERTAADAWGSGHVMGLRRCLAWGSVAAGGGALVASLLPIAGTACAQTQTSASGAGPVPMPPTPQVCHHTSLASALERAETIAGTMA